MAMRSIWMTLILLVLAGVVKAHIHFLRLVVLAAAGLAGMYMVHLLAQDWTKIRPNRPAATRLIQQALQSIQGISKRSIPDDMFIDETLNEIPTWDAALEQDPLGCARKLVCSLATRPRSSLRAEETNILAMIRAGVGDGGSGEFEEAAEIGETTRQESACDHRYPKCYYSASQLVKILRTF